MYTMELNFFILFNDCWSFHFLILLPQTMRVERGSETDVMATIHCFLREKQGDLENPTDAVLYGPSTQNDIERWWRDLHARKDGEVF